MSLDALGLLHREGFHTLVSLGTSQAESIANGGAEVEKILVG